jgi:hypothetical protein
MLGETGRQPALAGTPDRALDLVGRIACYDYRPARRPTRRDYADGMVDRPPGAP